MKRNRVAAVLALSAILGTMTMTMTVAHAQIAGTSSVGHVENVVDIEMIARGWSAKKSIIGKTVYNDKTEAIGKVEDLIIEPLHNVSYLIVGVGGFVGLGRHDVAVPASDIMELDGRIVLLGGTKAELKAMPTFRYTRLSTRDRIAADAESVITMSEKAIADLQQRSGAAADVGKAAMDRQMVALRGNKNELQAKLGEMKAATGAQWKRYEADINDAMARLKVAIKQSMT